MRGWAVAALLLVPVAQAVTAGPAQTLADFPVELIAPARGDGFTAWVDVRAGQQQVLVHFDDDGDTARLLKDAPRAVQSLAAWGHWIAWSQLRAASIQPGEQAPRVNWDVVVYDLDRRAVVYDSATALGNETDPALGGGRLAFVDDAGGVAQVQLADLTGRRAFDPGAAAPSGLPQGAPAVDGDAAVFVEDTADGPRLVRAKDGQADVLVAAQEGLGLGAVAAWDGRVAWVETRGTDSRLVVRHDGASQSWNWTGQTVVGASGEGSLTVADLHDRASGLRSLHAWCAGDEPERLRGGVESRPAVADGRVASLVRVGFEQFVQDRELSCGDAPKGHDAPGAGLPLALALLALAAMRRKAPST